MSGLGQFSLRWNNFHSNLSTGFHDLLKEEQLVDVTLATEGKLIKAHQVVLSVCSPFFRKIFHTNPCQHPVVILNISYRELRDILTFIYQGEVNVQQENLSGFLKAAELLQIKGLAGDDNDNTSDAVEKNIAQKREHKSDQDNNSRTEHTNIPDYLNSNDEIQKYPSQFRRIPLTSKSTSNSCASNKKKRSNSSVSATNLNENKYLFQSDKLTTATPQSQEFDSGYEQKYRRSHDDSRTSRIDEIPTTVSEMYSDGEKDSSHMNTNSHMNTMDHISEDMSDDADNVQIKWERDDYDETTSISNTASGLESFPNFDKENGKQELKKSSYQCEICCKCFTRRDHLKTHHKNIHGEDKGPFACHICSQLYKNSESLRKHVSKFHSTKMDIDVPKESNKYGAFIYNNSYRADTCDFALPTTPTLKRTLNYT